MTENLAGQQELFPHHTHTTPGQHRCPTCGRFLSEGAPCANRHCTGEETFAHVPESAIVAAAAARNCLWSPRITGHPLGPDCANCRRAAAHALAAAWPHILKSLNIHERHQK